VLQSLASIMSDTFTAEQVAEHNTRDDIWFAIHGKVYDVTGFLDEHPGGEEVCNADDPSIVGVFVCATALVTRRILVMHSMSFWAQCVFLWLKRG
jgi:hypothetical protein